MNTAFFSRTRRRFAAAGLAAVLAASAGSALADAAWPSKPIRWINPYSAGGGTDQSSRIIAEKLAVALGQPIVIDNKPGGNTIIGAAAAASSPADGYTVFYAALSTMSVIPSLYEKLPYASDALVPVAVVRFPLFLMVQDKGPIDTMDKFLAAARTQPLNFAIGGSGSGGHLGSELVKRKLNANMTAIPFKAMVQAAPEVAAGRVSFMFADLPAALPMVQSGRAKILATAGKSRSSLYPEAPTLREAGVGDIEFGTWAGVAVPKGTPQAIVDRLATELAKVLEDPGVKAKLALIGVEPAPSTQAQFTRLIADETEKWRAVIRDANIKVE